MTRTPISTLTATAALIGALLAAPAWAQADKPADKPADAAPATAPAATPAPAAADKPADAASSGLAAVYTTRLNGRRTASGERYNMNALTAAHMTLPMGTMVKVTGAKNKRSVVVRINDRGPTQAGRVLDLSSAAARKLGMKRPGLMQVSLEVVGQPKAKAARK
jgi:rare lipoprotein A